jgi:hypothetical protein
LLALAACKQAPPPEPAVPEEEVAAQLARVKVEPGQWERTTEILAAEGAVSEAERSQIVGRKTTSSDCITPAQAERPSANFLAAQQNSECTYHEFRMQGGKLSSRTSCVGKDSPDQLVTVMTGDYAPDSYDMRTKVQTPGQAGLVTITTRTRGKRVGECTAQAD